MTFNKSAIVAAAMLLLASVTITAQQSSCSNFSWQMNTASLFDNFTTIEIGPPCPSIDGSAVAIPSSIHWHIHPIFNASFMITANMEGLVVPSVSSDGSVLQFTYGNAIPFASAASAGVEIVVPSGNLTTISITGVAHVVEIMDTFNSVKFLQDRGVNNAFYVTSSSNIEYATNAVNGTAEIEAPNVVVRMGGTGGNAQVKGASSAEMSGIDNTLVVEGNATVSASGVASTVQVNGALEIVADTGINNTIENTDATVTVSNVDCVGPKGAAACSDGGTIIISSSATMTFAGRGVMLLAIIAFGVSFLAPL